MKPKRILNIIIGLCGAMIVLAIFVFFIRDRLPQYMTGEDPESVVSNYLTAILREEYDRAYGYLAEWEEKPSFPAFKEKVQGLNGFQFCVTLAKYYNENQNEARIYIDTYNCEDTAWQINMAQPRAYPDKREVIPNEAQLVRQQGVWKIQQMPLPWWDQGWITEE